MENKNIALHPSVATLVASLGVQDGRVAWDPAALSTFLASSKQWDEANRELVITHLIAWSQQAKRLGASNEVLIVVVALVLELMGDAAKVADAFEKAGVSQAAALVGKAQAIRAPAAVVTVPTAAPVQARRGLSKKPSP